MPTISQFFAPPHFHAKYGDHEALIQIAPLGILKGSLPHRALSLVMEWAAIHNSELMVDWKLAENHQKLKSIKPLD